MDHVCFWLGVAGLLALAGTLGRWHTEEVARQIAQSREERPASEACLDAPCPQGSLRAVPLPEVAPRAGEHA